MESPSASTRPGSPPLTMSPTPQKDNARPAAFSAPKRSLKSREEKRATTAGMAATISAARPAGTVRKPAKKSAL